RLRALGDAVPDWEALDSTGELVDLAATGQGGRVIDASDMFFGDAQNMLMPGPARTMADGWETRRRRGPGNDWVVIQLGAAGRIPRVAPDTSHFKGNAPGACELEGCAAPGAVAEALRDSSSWHPLLPRTRLLPHTLHRFQDELSAADPAPVTHVR